ncbi:EF-hand domain-containing protein [uncultured Brevundimonas sp.]|uniref:EF-hand domain-containing protein n=1 Tax=uncultured Brevundimonas sp. TaxID=213418 RepID=UPI0025F39FF7|nr:EF-hand domain-containing protein [uncultured Brevundimonas sp.]
MRNTFLTGLGVIALAAAAGAATAQVPPAGATAPHQARGEPNRQMTRADFVDARIARLTALDTNRDGTVSVEERAAAMQARRAERAGDRFAKLDANGDGSISRAEFDAGHAARPDRGPRAARAGDREGRHGGAHHAMRGQGRERGPVVIAEASAKLGERFDKIDANRDGVISADERRAVMSAQREQRQERRAARQTQHQAQQPASPVPASE